MGESEYTIMRHETWRDGVLIGVEEVPDPPDDNPPVATSLEVDAAADEAALDAYNAVINVGALSMARIRDAIRASEEARIAYKRAALR